MNGSSVINGKPPFMKDIRISNVSGEQGQQIWDTRKINAGVYFYTFAVNGITESGKIIINK